jgi:hypothetical protein
MLENKMTILKAKVSKKTAEYINLKINKEDFESFCSSAGLFKKGFFRKLESSEKDHRQGKIKERNSLYELIKGKR